MSACIGASVARNTWAFFNLNRHIRIVCLEQSLYDLFPWEHRSRRSRCRVAERVVLDALSIRFQAFAGTFATIDCRPRVAIGEEDVRSLRLEDVAMAEFFKAFAALLWPAFAFVVFMTYKEEIRNLIKGKGIKGKFFGQEFEIVPSLELLEAKAKIAEASLPATPAQRDELASDPDPATRILREAATAPKVALMDLSGEIDRELRNLLLSTGWHTEMRTPSSNLKQELEALVQKGVLTESISGSATLFRDVRHKLVHSSESNEDAILSAIDSGLTILRALRAIPHESHFVKVVDVPVYEDEGGTKPRADVKGVILRSVSPAGVRETIRIFPTTKRNYVVGMQVGWEWNMDRIVNTSWYRDPDSNEIKFAWHESLEFTGNPLETTSG
jgi:hypothetical protein